jgi:hypothetical protein
MVTAPQTFEKYRFNNQKFTVLMGPSNAETTEASKKFSAPNRAYLNVIAQTITNDGAGSRLDRWRLGAETFRSSLFVGQGFSYHRVFAERFVGGKFLDHPHLPLLSEGIIGGILLFMVTGAIYVYLLFVAVTSSRTTILSGAPLAFILASGVAGISGDTLFPIFNGHQLQCCSS